MGRTAGYKKHDYNYRMDPYIEGNVVRKAAYAEPMPEVRRERQPQRRPATSTATRRNRARALQMNVGYVMFLTAAAVATLFVCVHYLQLQARSTELRKEIASLEGEYSNLKMENDAVYENAVSSVDLEHVKEIAINELGMVYADEGQVITYDSQAGDYVRQYRDVPTE